MKTAIMTVLLAIMLGHAQNAFARCEDIKNEQSCRKNSSCYPSMALD